MLMIRPFGNRYYLTIESNNLSTNIFDSEDLVDVLCVMNFMNGGSGTAMSNKILSDSFMQIRQKKS
jgi:hypothetical protein